MEYIQDLTPSTVTELILLFIAIGMMLSFGAALYALRRQKQIPKTTVLTVTENSAVLEELQDQILQLQKNLDQAHEHLPQTAVVRFNPFKDSGVGGKQSFSLASVNRLGHGFIITHLFSREMSRVSTKHITAWDCDIELSQEEKQALEEIKNNS